jgi:hypothetical protein
MHVIGVCLMGVHLISVYLMDVHLMGVYLRAPSLSHVGMVGDVAPVPFVLPAFDDGRPIVRVLLWIWLFFEPLLPRCINEEFETSRVFFVCFRRCSGFSGTSDSLTLLISIFLSANLTSSLIACLKALKGSRESRATPLAIRSNAFRTIGVPQYPRIHA